MTQDQEDPGNQFRNLEEALAQARESNERVLIFSHIPPGKFERFYQRMLEADYSGFHWMSDKFNKRYLDVVHKYRDVLELQLFAHHHTDSFKIFRSLEGLPIGLGLVAPGLTPWNSTLAPETGANNPALRLFEFNKTSGQIVDYHQFYLNLTKANMNEAAEWELEYSFRTYFNIAQMSPESISGLLDSMMEDDILFNNYYAINTVLYESADDAVANCDATCRSYHYCAMSQLDYSKFEDCISSPAGPVIMSKMTWISLFLVLLNPILLSSLSSLLSSLSSLLG